MIRPRSALGLKYIEVDEGRLRAGIPRGRHDPARERDAPSLSSSTSSSTCGTSPRASATSRTCAASATRSPGRGADLNLALQQLVPLVAERRAGARPTSRRRRPTSGASSPRRRRPRSSPSRSRCSSASCGATSSLTLAAFADVARPFLQDTISKGPSGQETFIEEAPTLRPFFRATGKFFAELQPGTDALRATCADELASGFERGVKGLEGSPGLNRRLSTFLGDLEDFAQDPIVPIGFKDLIQTVKALDPLISHITPAQTVCNYTSLFFRNAASILSDGDSNGTWLRFMVITTPVGPDGGPAPNGEGGPSAAPANGGGRLIDRLRPQLPARERLPEHRGAGADA